MLFYGTITAIIIMLVKGITPNDILIGLLVFGSILRILGIKFNISYSNGIRKLHFEVNL